MTRDGTVGRFRRNRAKPGVSSGHRSRLNDEDSVRGPHQGQQSTRTAPTGRTHDCKRPLRCTPNDLLPGGGHPHMNRRDFITLIGGAAAAWPLAARAQQSERMRRIGVLNYLAADDPDSPPRVAAFAQALQGLGWIDGRNIEIDYRWGGGDLDRTRRYATELVALGPDVILVSSGSALAALQNVTRTVPIVFVSVSDPLGGGYVASLARPGGNTTGFTLFEWGTSGKWLELLIEIVPAMTRAAVIRDTSIISGTVEFVKFQAVGP